MAVVFGKVEYYDKDQEDWPQYVERLEHFFAANEISSAEKKRSVFLSVIGPTPYKLLRNLLAPEKPSDKSFAELVAVLSAHYSPKPSKIVQCFRFHACFRKPGGSITHYVAKLRAIA